MPTEETQQSSPGNWLARAKSNLVLAKMPMQEGLYWEDLCFNLQQSVEKSLKVVLIDQGVPFPYTHQIGLLIKLIKESNISWNAELDVADDLSDYAIATGYPGSFEPVTEAEYCQAVDIAEQIMTWAESMIQPDRPQEANQNLDLDLQARPEEQA